MLKDDVRYCTPSYIYDGHDVGITDEILVRFLPNVQNSEQKKVYEKFKTKVVEKNEIFQLLVIPKGSDALEIANQYYETGLFEFAYPSFISYPIFHQVIPNDTYFGNQVTCHNTGQTFTDGHSGTTDADIDAPEAWGITRGCSDVIIAVIDQGVTSNHPDLPDTRQVRLDGSNFGDGNANDPSPTGNSNHGNACAGVIAATMNNNQGIAGIAPNCIIMPIRIDNATGPDIAMAITFAVNNGADILSN
ncbi:MAG: S8 family serine peptidase, partial [Draconibacterium sp.]|nr:S8 family serine peptidase [Draconibacterium sp.]